MFTRESELDNITVCQRGLKRAEFLHSHRSFIYAGLEYVTGVRCTGAGRRLARAAPAEERMRAVEKVLAMSESLRVYGYQDEERPQHNRFD